MADAGDVTLGRGEGGPAERVGPYPVVGTLGAGGMGEVFAALDESVGREVAVKRARAGDAEQRARFVFEGRVTGQLEHPGIPPVYAIGEGYIAMRRIGGRELGELIDGPARAARLRELLRIFVRVCEAVAFAHSRRVLHRDLKPANVMVGEFGEVYVMDWGLARRLDGPAVGGGSSSPVLDAGPRTTLDGAIVGTPAYMPPEQARGDVETLDERADIYSLGAILYEVLTGRPPYDGSVMSVLDAVERGELVPPSRRVGGVPPELDAVVRVAMSARPEGRYANARRLAEDVEAFLADRSVSVHRDGAGRRLSKWVRRHPAAAIAVTLVAVFGGALGGVSAVLLGREARAQRQAAAQAAAREAAEARVARERMARLEALARSGELARLVDSLGGQLIERKDRLIVEFRALHAEASKQPAGQRMLAKRVGRARLERTLDAFDQLFEANAKDPRRVPVEASDHYLRGAVLWYLDRASEAIESYGKALALERRPSFLFNRALAYERIGKYEAALADCEEVAKIQPNVESELLRSGCLRALGRLDESLEAVARVVTQYPEEGMGYYYRALTHVAAGRDAEAMADFGRAERRIPTFPFLYFFRAKAHRARGRLDEAAADYGRAIQRKPDFATAYNNLGNVHRARRDYERALASYGKAIEVDPNDGRWRISRALVWSEQGDFIRAIADLREGLRLAPDVWQGWTNLGVCLAEVGQRAQAEAAFARALQVCPAGRRSFVVETRRRKLGK